MTTTTMMTTMDASSATATSRDGGLGEDPRALAERITIEMSDDGGGDDDEEEW
jgi:hypothetical protein